MCLHSVLGCMIYKPGYHNKQQKEYLRACSGVCFEFQGFFYGWQVLDTCKSALRKGKNKKPTYAKPSNK